MPVNWSFRKTSNKNGHSCQAYCCFMAIQLIKNIFSLKPNLEPFRISLRSPEQYSIKTLNDMLRCFAIFNDKWLRYLMISRINTFQFRWKRVTQNISSNITICGLIGSDAQLRFLNVIYFPIQRHFDHSYGDLTCSSG